MTRSFACTFVVLIACGDDAPATHDTTAADATTAPDSAPDSALEVEPDTDPVDTVEDIEPEVIVPTVCAAGASCNTLLNEDGACPGACFAIPDAPTCAGEVHDGLCYRFTLTEQFTTEADFGDFFVEPIKWPAETTVGATSDLEVRVSNKTGQALSIPFHTKDPGTFTFTDASWAGLTTIDIPPLQSVTLSAEVTAVEATILQAGAGIIVTFNFNDQVWEPWSKVHFADTEAIACGGEFFPETWCRDRENCYSSTSFYMSAECCDDVFYPSAQCCSDADCVGGGGCVDGKCVRDVPALNSANTLPLGNQRVLLVIIEENADFTFDPCADRAASMSEALQLGLVEAWFDAVATRRFGASTLDLRWEVKTGMRAEDVLQPGDGNDGNTYLTRIDEYMRAQGCGPVLDTYDKLIVAANGMDLGGYGAVYASEGHIMSTTATLPYLLTHELAHSFGAFDLYLDLGGTFQFWSTLMGNNVHGDPIPGDDVAWGEMGYADFDDSGVIDVAEHAAFPETFEIADVKAVLTTKNTVEISWRFIAREDGTERAVIVSEYELTVPGTPTRVWFGASTRRIQVYGEPEVDLAALRAAGQIEAHFKAELRTTDRDWQRIVLTIDETRIIPITIQE